MVHRDRQASVAEMKSRIVWCVTTEILNTMVDHDVLTFQHVVAYGGSHTEHIL